MLNSQKTIEVTLEGGSKETFTVSELKLKDFQRALLASNNEFALNAIFCGQTTEKVLTLEPDSYEQLHAVCKEANRAFFAFLTRRAKEISAQLDAASPTVLAAFAKATSQESRSTGSQPGLLPHAA